ncbi:MAG: methyltransferase domain-containing protein, partial [Cyanobacteria bacterium P01_H01_bin.35]
MTQFKLTTSVVLIIFNRPDTTAKVFQAIRQVKPPQLFVIADAPRHNKPGEFGKCMEARKIINLVDWECEVLTNYAEVNLGCRERIYSGLNWVFSLVESAIILEDDCVPHPTFFQFCQELLEKYRDNNQVMAISGDNFQFGNNPTKYSYYFSRYSHCWGWATWQRAWKNYDDKMQLWSKFRDSKWLENILQNSEAVQYWSEIFEKNYRGFNSWAYAWVFACWNDHGLTILPKVNLVSNIGFSREATHTSSVNKFANMSVEEMIFPLNHPLSIIRNIQADDFTEKIMFSGSLPSQNIYCKVCGSISHKFDTAQVLNKYKIDYFQCSNCQFVQTENPYWLDEAYKKAIASSDLGLVSRNQNFSLITENLILNFFNADDKFLDYGCGYGLFVRMMRDLGLNFYGYDKYCQNIFYEGWEGEINGEEKYELVTAFEVFEHFINPLAEIEKILQQTRNILFSTQLLPSNNPGPNDWWYYALEEGQHISIFTRKALSVIAEKFKLNLCSDGESLHLLTDKNLSNSEFKSIFGVPRYQPKKRKETLTQLDYKKVIERKQKNQQQLDLKVLIDGVFFQLNNTGIARVWKSLLEVWSKYSFGQNILVLDRAKTAPKIPGIKYRVVPEYNYGKIDVDREMLQTICDEENVDLFISTYYTTPILTPSIFMAYDMIPEVLAKNLDHPSWQEKHRSIKQAISYISISENTGRDLVKYFPQIPTNSVKVAHCGIEAKFSRANPQEVANFQQKYQINRPYFLIVGERIGWLGYKNTILFFQAFAKLENSLEFEIVCIGGNRKLEPELSKYVSGSKIHLLQLSDQELTEAYSGAIALVYPSKYEGFGLPILEAMACGCPVITCKNASIPEVAGIAALYIDDNDINGLANALDEVQKSEVRQQLISAGLAQAQKFSWSQMAKIMTDVFIQTFNRIKAKELSAMEDRKNLGEIQFQINHGQLEMQRHFWNVNSLDKAMFERVFTDNEIHTMSPQEKMDAWENSVLSSTEKVLQGIPIKVEWKVLEIGCGVGRLIKYLREKFAQVDGVDISENMIQFAKQYLADGKQNGEVYVNNGYDLQTLADQSYDFIYSTIVFQHIRSISIVKSYFRETFRILKPGGYFRLQVHDNSAANLGNFDEEGKKNQQYYLSGNGYTDTQLKDLFLVETDFDLVSLECSKPWIWVTVKRPEKEVFLPLVSAIISTYNSEKFIRGCLEDLVTQTLYEKGKLEILIIDSASTEKEGAIAQEFQSKYPHIIYYRTRERESIYAAWNRAIKIAKGNYITNANTDDRHCPDALEKMGDYLNNNPDTSLVYADQLITTFPNDVWAKTQGNKCWNWPEFDYQELERRCIIGSQPMWRKSLHQKYGYFRSEFKVAGDYEFWLRIGKTEKIARFSEILGLYFENDQGLEKSSKRAAQETYNICLEYGIIQRGVRRKISVVTEISESELISLPFRESQRYESVEKSRDSGEELSNFPGGEIKKFPLRNFQSDSVEKPRDSGEEFSNFPGGEREKFPLRNFQSDSVEKPRDSGEELSNFLGGETEKFPLRNFQSDSVEKSRDATSQLINFPEGETEKFPLRNFQSDSVEKFREATSQLINFPEGETEKFPLKNFQSDSVEKFREATSQLINFPEGETEKFPLRNFQSDSV